MPAFMTAAARVWLDPEFRRVGTLPPYPSPQGSWDQLFSAIEVESAERALKAVRADLSSWRKPASGRSDAARASFDEVIRLIDLQIEAINTFAWGAGPRPAALEDLCLDVLLDVYRDLEVAGAKGGASVDDLRELAVWIWAVIEGSASVPGLPSRPRPLTAEYIIERARSVMDPDAVATWLCAPVRALGDERPIDRLVRGDSASVERLLAQLENDAFA